MKKLLLLVVGVFFTHTTFAQWVEITPQDYLRYTETITGRYTTYPHSIADTTKGDVLVRTIKFNQVKDTMYFYTQQGEWWKEKYYGYRQRIYKTYPDTNGIHLEIFALPNEKEYYSLVEDLIPYEERYLPNEDTTFRVDVERLKEISETDYIEKVGCDIYIKMDSDGTFWGSTLNDECKGSYAGANYTTSKFQIYNQYLVSWERGWTDDGEQKWGPKSSPYIYFKIAKH